MRQELAAYGLGIFMLSVAVLYGVFELVMALRHGSLPDEALALVAALCAGDLALLAWTAILVRQWVVLGEATLLFSPVQPRVGQRFTCRVQFARTPAAQGTAVAKLICQRITRSRVIDRKTKETREQLKTTELWRDAQTVSTPGRIEFTFDPPQNLPPAGDAAHWALELGGHASIRFQRRFHVPLEPATSELRNGVLETFEHRFAALAPIAGPVFDRVFKIIYSLCAIVLLAIGGITAWGVADYFQLGPASETQLDGSLRLGDLRQSIDSNFAARFDGRFVWQPGRLSVYAESLRLRAWDCEGTCPRIREFDLSLWVYTEDELGDAHGELLTRSDSVTIDKLPQDGVSLDLDSPTFVFRLDRDSNPREMTLVLEVRTEQGSHQYGGQRFGGVPNLRGLVQSPGEAETCADVNGVRAALEDFCHGRFVELLSAVESPVERQRLLFLAVSRGNIAAVQALVAAQVPVDPANRHGYTPLMVSAILDLPQIAAVLLEAGANPDFVAIDSSPVGGATPLGAALAGGCLQCVQVLLDKGADPDAMHRGIPLVHVAVAADVPEALAMLAKKGADLDARAAWENQPTPLMAAAGAGKLQVVDKLLELGVDPASVDRTGNTARDYAATNKRREVLERFP